MVNRSPFAAGENDTVGDEGSEPSSVEMRTGLLKPRTVPFAGLMSTCPSTLSAGEVADAAVVLGHAEADPELVLLLGRDLARPRLELAGGLGVEQEADVESLGQVDVRDGADVATGRPWRTASARPS